MSKLVKMEVHVDVNNPQQLESLNTFLKSLSEDSTITGNFKSAAKTADAKPAAKPAAGKKVEPAKAEIPKESPAPDVEETETEQEEGAAEVKIEDLRALVQSKVTVHRDAIKNKLTELGAANVTSLAADKYVAFNDFLTAL